LHRFNIIQKIMAAIATGLNAVFFSYGKQSLMRGGVSTLPSFLLNLPARIKVFDDIDQYL
jgi:hypothetical protein